MQSPLVACRETSAGDPCAEIWRNLRNPYYIGDEPGLTQTSGWVDAWISAPSAYAVAATKTEDVVAAVNFARENHLRLVVKGGGHSYQGTPCAADSLLIWTRAMNSIVLHDAFVAARLRREAGAATRGHGRGGRDLDACLRCGDHQGRPLRAGRGLYDVGVAGLIQSGGFGSFSKTYGLAAAGLLEAEVVTADGAVRIANACTHPDLFWGIKGGGWRQPRRRHPAHAQDPRAPPLLRRRVRGDQGDV